VQALSAFDQVQLKIVIKTHSKGPSKNWTMQHCAASQRSTNFECIPLLVASACSNWAAEAHRFPADATAATAAAAVSQAAQANVQDVQLN
jgi:hypothetical protein